MDSLKEKIVREGIVRDNNILKVDMFLNHQIDVEFMEDIGQEIYNRFKDNEITKILTIEASGIAIGSAVARAFKVPLLFAKKEESRNLDGELLENKVTSFTKGKEYTVTVSKRFLTAEDKVLIVDDFLANGSALLGLKGLVDKSGATMVGAAIVIEKSFQPGRTIVDNMGMNVYSLVRIKEIVNGKVTFLD